MTGERGIGYVRVSTTEQVAGFGLDVQLEAVQAWDGELVAVYSDEGESGSNGLDHRVGLAEALARIEAGEAEALVVYRLDRLARDLLLQETLIARLRVHGARLVSTSEPDLDTDSDDPTRILIRQILGAIGQYERAIIRGRLNAGKRIKKARGGHIGGPAPYGSRLVDRNLSPQTGEAEVVDLIHELRAAGLSLRAIGAELTERGLRPRNGGVWHPHVIARITRRDPSRGRGPEVTEVTNPHDIPRIRQGGDPHEQHRKGSEGSQHRCPRLGSSMQHRQHHRQTEQGGGSEGT